MKLFTFVLLFIFNISIQQGNAQDLSSEMNKQQFIFNQSDTLLYRFWNPFFLNNKTDSILLSDILIKNTTKIPLIVFLHGAGERGNDNTAQLIHGVRTFVNKQNQLENPSFVIAPQCPKGKRWVEVDWRLEKHNMPDTISTYLGAVISLIDSLEKQYPIDTNRIYITGLSMGGFGTWDLISRYPDKFAAAVPICGGADENQAEKLTNIPIWAFHGGADKLVKVERSRNIIKAIREKGGTPKYTEFPKTGHLVWNKAYAEPQLLNWIYSQKKN